MESSKSLFDVLKKSIEFHKATAHRKAEEARGSVSYPTAYRLWNEIRYHELYCNIVTRMVDHHSYDLKSAATEVIYTALRQQSLAASGSDLGRIEQAAIKIKIATEIASSMVSAGHANPREYFMLSLNYNNLNESE